MAGNRVETAGDSLAAPVAPRANRFAAALFARLAAYGVRDLFFSPGARCAPLAGGVVAEPRLRRWSVIDERSASFMALGAARASRHPAVLICTSGTAALHYLPALAEARLGGIPLWVVAADRPLTGGVVGTPQTVNIPELSALVDVQIRLELAALAEPEWEAQSMVDRIVLEEGLSAVVWLQLGIEEPLSTVSCPQDSCPSSMPTEGQNPVVVSGMEEIARRIRRSRRGVIYAGACEHDATEGAAALRLSERTGFALLTDAAHPARYAGSDTIAWHHGLPKAILEKLSPDLVLRTGAWPAIRTTGDWLGRSAGGHLYFGKKEKVQDPWRRMEARHRFSFDDLVKMLDKAPVSGVGTSGRDSGEWRSRWQATHTKVPNLHSGNDFLACELVNRLPANSVLLAANSSAIRALDRCSASRTEPLRIFANRGASGIEGHLAMAAGMATAGTPVTLWMGDLAFVHDAGSLAEIRRHNLPVSILISDNHGGGIFRNLPMAQDWSPEAEQLIRAPHDLPLADIVRGFGLPVKECHWSRAVELLMGFRGVVICDPDASTQDKIT